MSPSAKRRGVEHLQQAFEVSQRRACRVLGQNRTTQRYRMTRPNKDKALVADMLRLAAKHKRFGYRRITKLLQDEGWQVNPKRVYRLWRQAGLQVKRKPNKKRYLGCSENSVTKKAATRPNEVWTVDFLFDQTERGQRLKIMPVIDEFTRECKAILVSCSITSEDVMKQLNALFAQYGAPANIRCDNGPEYMAKLVERSLKKMGVEPLFIKPGAPWENGYSESFNARLRDELLDRELFSNVLEAQVIIEQWRKYYNEQRPHSSLNYATPSAFADRWTQNNHRLS